MRQNGVPQFNGGLCIKTRGLHRKTLDGFNQGCGEIWFLLRRSLIRYGGVYTSSVEVEKFQVQGQPGLCLCQQKTNKINRKQNRKGRRVEKKEGA